MAKHRIGKKVGGRKSRRAKASIVPAHLLGKSLHKKVGRKRSSRKRA